MTVTVAFIVLYVLGTLSWLLMYALNYSLEKQHDEIKKELQEIKKMVGEDK